MKLGTTTLTRLAVALIVAPLAGLAFAQTASATTSYPFVTSKATIVSSPDDGCPAWARDTFTRTTTIVKVGEGKYKVKIEDSGAFTTKAGADSPGDPAVKIGAEVKGSLTGSGEFTVTGTLLDKEARDALNGATYDNGQYACKGDVPADRTTGHWPLKFFTQGATTTGIDPWKWIYKTPCESRTESSKAAPVGNITGKVCPSASASASASASPRVTRSADSTATKAPTPSTSPVAATLPVTGTSGTLALVGLAAVLIGGAAIFMGRVRRNKVQSTTE